MGKCNFCGYETEELFNVTVYRSGNFVTYKEEGKICKLCHSTHIGNAYMYPEQYNNRDIFRCMAQITHIILDSIKDFKK